MMKKFYPVLALFILVLPFCKPAELKSLEKLTLRATVHTDTSNIQIQLLNEQVKRKPDVRSTYYWFAHGNVNTSQGYYSGKLLDGKYAEFDRTTKRPIVSGTFSKGLKSGRWLIWKKDGSIKEVQYFKNGSLNGPMVRYNASGYPEDTLKYSKGNLVMKKVEPDDTSKVSILNKVKRFLKLKMKK